jgi:S-adenosyl-L-methionine hydrolase (adenosine-forming)
MVITLLTDFGTTDYFVGAMKGAILSINKRARIVDITHEIAPHDVEAGAWTLLNAYCTFPRGTIHVGVVDPGVGSARRPIVVASRNYLFVGPDNGLFTYIYESEKNCRIFHLTNKRFFRASVSPTFHGRDLFAPVAAWLAKGTLPEECGEEISDPVRINSSLVTIKNEDATLDASIIHIDRFGNCITNITPRDITEEAISRGVRLIVGERIVNNFRRYFADETSSANDLFALWGSAGFLEIAALKLSAARVLNARRGQHVQVIFD